MPPPAPVSSAWRPLSRSRSAKFSSFMLVDELPHLLRGPLHCRAQALVAGDRTPQPRVLAQGLDRVGAVADGMCHGRVHALVLVGVRQGALVPALQKGEKERRQ